MPAIFGIIARYEKASSIAAANIIGKIFTSFICSLKVHKIIIIQLYCSYCHTLLKLHV